MRVPSSVARSRYRGLAPGLEPLLVAPAYRGAFAAFVMALTPGIALYALVLADQAAPGVDVTRAVKMLLIHDLVEIDVGDVPIHSGNGQAHDSAAVQAAEAAAAKRIFGLLPEDLGDDLHVLWQEFEAAETPTAIFAKSLDRVQPVLLNLQSGGGSWLEYDVTWPQLETRVGAKIARGLPGVWDWVQARIRPWFSARGR